MAILARSAGGRNVIGLTIGPNSIVSVHSAARASDVQHSMQSRSTMPITEKRWSLRRRESKPSASASWQMRRHRSQLRPSWPSIMIPSFAIARNRNVHLDAEAYLVGEQMDLSGARRSARLRQES